MHSLKQDEAAFLAAIRERPDDDLPRLVYADWLDERAGDVACPDSDAHGRNRKCRNCGAVYVHIHKYSGCDGPACEGEESHPVACPTCKGTGRVSNGFAARAEFIRVQCELANRKWLVDPHEGHTCAATPCPMCSDVADHKELWKVERHWLETNRRQIKAAIPPLNIGLLRQAGPENGWHPDGDAYFHRGFIAEFRAPLQSCLDHLPALVRHPSAVITWVRVTDREPQYLAGSYLWFEDDEGLYRNRFVTMNSQLPTGVFDSIARPVLRHRRHAKRFDSRELAESALSAALLALAENPVTPPSIPGESDGSRGSD